MGCANRVVSGKREKKKLRLQAADYCEAANGHHPLRPGRERAAVYVSYIRCLLCGIDEHTKACRMPFQTSESHMQQALAFYTLHMGRKIQGGPTQLAKLAAQPRLATRLGSDPYNLRPHNWAHMPQGAKYRYLPIAGTGGVPIGRTSRRSRGGNREVCRVHTCLA